MNAVRDAAIKKIAQTWSVSDSELSQQENGFDWLPGSHTVHVRIFDHTKQILASQPPGRLRISISTDYLRSVPIESHEFVRRVGVMSKFECSGYSLVYPPYDIWKKYFKEKPAELQLFSSAYVDEAIAGWLSRFLAQIAIMQPINAEIRSTTAPEMFGGGEPAFAGGSKKANVDDILTVADTKRGEAVLVGLR